jgi:hypothetical protein
MFVVLYQAKGLAFGFAALTNINKYLADPKNKKGRRRFQIALVTLVLGAFVCFGSITAGDARRNAGCEDACEEAGWNTGRYRGDPHETPDGPSEYECWCLSNKEWSPEPVAVDDGEQ